MALHKRGKWWYGESQADIHDEILRYSKSVTYLARHYADAACKCGSKLFNLLMDSTQCVAVRVCVACGAEHPIEDSDEFLESAELEECACPCGNEEFEMAVGVSLYENSEDVKWLYLGCRCPKCGLTAVYGDWKNEFIKYQNLLDRV